VTGIAAGLHLLVELPPEAGDEQAVVRRAADRYGLALAELGRFRYVPAPPDAPASLVVGYGTPPDHAFGRAVDALCAILAAR
jgi:GntR family transcriptional regulator/MocR family aminotransferase